MRPSYALPLRPTEGLPREKVKALHEVGIRVVAKRYKGWTRLDSRWSQGKRVLLSWQGLGVRQVLENLSGLEKASLVGRDSDLIFEKFDDLAHVFELIEHLLVVAAALRHGPRGDEAGKLIVELHFPG